MSHIFRVDIGALSEESSYRFHDKISSDFLDIKEEELVFETPITISGEAYLANDHLVIHIQAELKASMPCSICNKSAALSIEIKNHYFTKELAEIKDHYFDFSDDLRQTILLEVPSFIECEDGSCPSRKELQKFYKKIKPEEDEEKHFPFKGLENIFNNEG